MSFRKSCSESVDISRGCSTTSALLLAAPDDLDVQLLERVVEVVDLRGVELELVQRERNLLGGQRSSLATDFEQPLDLVRLHHLSDRRRLDPFPLLAHCGSLSWAL